VIVTLGDKGALWYDGAFHTMPAVKTQVADTIGAGDAHLGALLVGLMRNKSMEEAMELANSAASAAVSIKGSSLTDEQLRRLF
ncbi:MAG: PfkB family carbohydrate kinase, partial [Oscillospiraceae bacterium]